jgi:hypothetical protein
LFFFPDLFKRSQQHGTEIDLDAKGWLVEVRFYDVTNLPKAGCKKIDVTLKIFQIF